MSSSINVFVGVILVIASIAVVFMFVFGMRTDFKDASKFNICKTSVIKTSLVSTIDTNKKNVFSMCPSKGLEILEEKDYAFAKLFLDESESCWKKFGNGKLNPDIGGLWDQEVACFSCISFQVKEPVVNFPDLLNTYLQIGDYDLDESFLKLANENAYLIETYEESKGFKSSKESSLEPGVWYSLVNTFITNRDWIVPAGYVNKYDTYSKLALIKNSNVKNVCNSVENV